MAFGCEHDGKAGEQTWRAQMNETACGITHEKRKAKLLSEFGKAKVGTVVEVDFCPKCGVYAKSKAIGLEDEGAWMIPSEHAEVQG
jgi:hypothetical protein